jgi:hypothetical protein
MRSISDNLLLAAASSAGGPSDPLFSQVETLLLFYGTNGQTSFSDSSDNNFTVSSAGTPALTTSLKLFGTTSLALNGSNQYIEVPGGTLSAILNLGSSNWTIEGWVSLSSTAAISCFAEMANNLSDNDVIIRYNNPGLYCQITTTTGNASFTGTWTPSTNTFYHIALTRNAGTLRGFVDGVLVGTSTSNSGSPVRGTSARWWVGRSVSGQLWPGNVDSFRVTIGTARYTATFTPPTAAFPDK